MEKDFVVVDEYTDKGQAIFGLNEDLFNMMK